uniref:Integrase core domain containing protein n=1 Tax=Solanum tuberosum TaxID=4113 RepID=M1DW90_SOLTU
MVTDIVTVSQFDEENTWIGSPTGSTSGSEAGSASDTQSVPASDSSSGSATSSISHGRAASPDEATDTQSVPASDSSSGSATSSISHGRAASPDEATSLGNILVPPNTDPALVVEKPNRWFVEGQWKIYWDAKMLNNKEKMARLITEECKVLTRSLHTIPDMHWLFQKHKCDWMAWSPGTYNEENMRKFYDSYAATL